MTQTINKAVGEGATTGWQDDDVEKVAALLNKVDPKEGGPDPKLRPKGFTGQQLIEAIRKFQMHHFGAANGRVDPHYLTMSMLNKFESGLPSGPVTSRLLALMWRARTVQQAQTMVGMTSNEPVDKDGNRIDPKDLDPKDPNDVEKWKRAERRGWRYLKEFFDVAGVSLPDREFRTFVPGKGRTPNKIGWCGVFATWALIKAGHAVKYALGKGICVEKDGAAGKRLPLIYAFPGKPAVATLGDVCVVNDKNKDAVTDENPEGFLFHHVIIASEPDGAGKFDTIEGNFPNKAFVAQCIVDATTSYHGRRSLNEIMYYYDVYRPASL